MAEYPLRADSREDIAAGVNEALTQFAMTLPHVIIGEKGVSLRVEPLDTSDA
ncbi:hypothetical protein [Ancylobacter defluvii]|uniref:Uncharacterized protein n=1 Tax=Ancylobacter defluvii TaxID=1282440 RepID=A0A9W6JVN1_9HYPH|nr:hypothetical protein [Ancylobacter defluvii]MBS7590081.1 hypothetical protein [Ancylobacter defluvii]GLK82699.1 hypothetical protein GCM10017653_07680 [Ancylobacter defluvii]